MSIGGEIALSGNITKLRPKKNHILSSRQKKREKKRKEEKHVFCFFFDSFLLFWSLPPTPPWLALLVEGSPPLVGSSPLPCFLVALLPLIERGSPTPPSRFGEGGGESLGWVVPNLFLLGLGGFSIPIFGGTVSPDPFLVCTTLPFLVLPSWFGQSPLSLLIGRSPFPFLVGWSPLPFWLHLLSPTLLLVLCPPPSSLWGPLP